MPIYEYYCGDCNYKFEELKSIKESQSSECPKCNKLAKRQVSLPGGLVFKGSGFYITDYTNKKGKADSGTEKSKKETSVSTSESVQGKTTVANDKN